MCYTCASLGSCNTTGEEDHCPEVANDYTNSVEFVSVAGSLRNEDSAIPIVLCKNSHFYFPKANAPVCCGIPYNGVLYIG